jgi:hypothetical protein
MDTYTSRMAAAFACLTAELYDTARAITPPGALDPFVILVGPEFRRQPALERYVNPSIVRAINVAMNGREELYSQMRDLLLLLQLQFNPLKPQRQRAIAQWYWQQFEICTEPSQLVWMTERECWAAMKRLTTFITADWNEEITRYVAWHVPFVLHTARMQHQLREATGRRVKRQPTLLTPQPFIWWFKERLLCAVKTRLDRCPENPLWVLPNGTMRGLHLATEQDYTDFGTWKTAVCQPVRRGPRSGPRDYADVPEFLETVAKFIRSQHDKGMSTAQIDVAQYLSEDIQTRRRDKGSAANHDNADDNAARLIRDHLPCPWQEFVEKALKK